VRHLALRRAVATSLILIGFGAASCGVPDAPPPQDVAPTETPVPTVPAAARPTYIVQRGDVQEVLRFSGRWLPADQVQLSFQIAGTVRRVNVQRGDTVTAGQLLADYQITALEDQLAAANLQLQAARSALESGNIGTTSSVADAEIALANAILQLDAAKLGSPWAEVEVARADRDAAVRSVESAQRAYDDAISRPNNTPQIIELAYDTLTIAKDRVRATQAVLNRAAAAFAQYQPSINTAENQVIAAQLALDRARTGAADPQRVQAVTAAQLTVDQLQESIRQSSLFAPIDGEVLDVLIRPGDNVVPFTVVMTIGIPEPKEAVAALAITDTQRLSVGLVGVCQEINRPETAVQCIVRRLPLDPREADQTTRVAASLEGVASGSLIEITMPLQVRQNVLWLPPAAIRTFQNRTFVVIQTADGQQVSDVQIGLRTPDRVEIISGVAEGDVVVGP
jgi:multidrug efflux pump subunit AcrA (membrane-fusion protein)